MTKHPCKFNDDLLKEEEFKLWLQQLKNFCNLCHQSFRISYMGISAIRSHVKGLRVTNIVKKIKFEGAWDKLEAKYCFQRQTWPKYMRPTLVLK